MQTALSNDDILRLVNTGEKLTIEYEAMDFVSHSTSIPLPRAYTLVPVEGDPEYSYLVMDYIDGQMLGKVWRTLSSNEKESVTRSVGAFVDELRKLPSSGMISSAKGGPFFDYRFAMDVERIGPFDNEREFNNWRISQFEKWGTPTQLAEIRRKMRDNHRVLFTHGDLSHFNIMVRRISDTEVVVAAILDWEQAGWRPEYWEALKIVFGAGRKGWLEVARRNVNCMIGYEDDIDRELSVLQGLSGGLC